MTTLDMNQLEPIEIRSLDSSELESVSGGGFWYDFAKWAVGVVIDYSHHADHVGTRQDSGSFGR